jgi:hypothetical protein
MVYKRLAWIAAGYAAAAVVAVAAIYVRYIGVDPAVVSASSGMYAGGDIVLFVLIAGTAGLIPTYFLARLVCESYPNAFTWAVFALACTGPLAWGMMLWLAMGYTKAGGPPDAIHQVLGLMIPFFAFPRVVASPVVLAVLGLGLYLSREKGSRRLLSLGLLLEGAPLAWYLLRLLRFSLR